MDNLIPKESKKDPMLQNWKQASKKGKIKKRVFPISIPPV
jgi:hypothetical protein